MAMDPMECIGQTFIGKVKSYSPDKGYGFITCDQLNADLFFIHKNLPKDVVDDVRWSGVYIKGEEVAFTCSVSPEGKPGADEIKLIADPDRIGARGGKGAAEYYEAGRGITRSFSKGGKKGGKKGGYNKGRSRSDYVDKKGTPLLDHRVQGTMKSYSNGSKWGFALIDPSDPSAGEFGDIFVHSNNLDNEMVEREVSLRNGDVIEFSLEEVDGKPVARQVTVIPKNVKLFVNQLMRGTIASYEELTETIGHGLISAPRVESEIPFDKMELPTSIANAECRGKSVMFKLVESADGIMRATLITPFTGLSKTESMERMELIVQSLLGDGYLDEKAAESLKKSLDPEALFSLLPGLEFYSAENPTSFIMGALNHMHTNRPRHGKGGSRGWRDPYSDEVSFYEPRKAKGGYGGKGYGKGGDEWDYDEWFGYGKSTYEPYGYGGYGYGPY